MSNKTLEALVSIEEEAIEQGNMDCENCGGRGWITIDSGVGDEFSQFEARCEKCNMREEDDSDMSGAE